jgi:hypothetical protein
VTRVLATVDWAGCRSGRHAAWQVFTAWDAASVPSGASLVGATLRPRRELHVPQSDNDLMRDRGGVLSPSASGGMGRLSHLDNYEFTGKLLAQMMGSSHAALAAMDCSVRLSQLETQAVDHVVEYEALEWRYCNGVKLLFDIPLARTRMAAGGGGDFLEDVADLEWSGLPARAPPIAPGDIGDDLERWLAEIIDEFEREFDADAPDADFADELEQADELDEVEEADALRAPVRPSEPELERLGVERSGQWFCRSSDGLQVWRSSPTISRGACKLRYPPNAREPV